MPILRDLGAAPIRWGGGGGGGAVSQYELYGIPKGEFGGMLFLRSGVHLTCCNKHIEVLTAHCAVCHDGLHASYTCGEGDYTVTEQILTGLCVETRTISAILRQHASLQQRVAP